MRLLALLLAALAGAMAAPSGADACGDAATASPPRLAADRSPLYLQAVDAEKLQKNDEAVALYVKASRNGSAAAAARLAEIHGHGLLGQPQNHTESQRWRNAARALSGDIAMCK